MTDLVRHDDDCFCGQCIGQPRYGPPLPTAEEAFATLRSARWAAPHDLRPEYVAAVACVEARVARLEQENERLSGFIESNSWIRKSDHEVESARLERELDKYRRATDQQARRAEAAEDEVARLEERLLLEGRRPDDQEKIDAWWRARSEVKVTGNSRAEYVLQRDAAIERAEAAEAEAARLKAVIRDEEMEARYAAKAEAEAARLRDGLRSIVEIKESGHGSSGWATDFYEIAKRTLAEDGAARRPDWKDYLESRTASLAEDGAAAGLTISDEGAVADDEWKLTLETVEPHGLCCAECKQAREEVARLRDVLIAMVYVHPCNCGKGIPEGACARCRSVNTLGFDPILLDAGGAACGHEIWRHGVCELCGAKVDK